MNPSDRPIPTPDVHPETEAYWQAAKEGKLLLRSCRACGEAHHYPRTICPHCGSDDTEYLQASGDGTIYSFSITRRAAVPYAIAYVTLAEGVSMMTNIVDCDFEALEIGQPVKVTFRQSEDGSMAVPMFTPA